MSLAELQDAELNICMKASLAGYWEPSSIGEVLSNLFEQTFPFSKEEKKLIPLFGFNKPLGMSENTQQFPTCFVILELDTPGAWKQRIESGCRKTLALARAKFWLWYEEFKRNPALPYYWMYLTPSTSGLRFVLRTCRPVEHEAHYRQVVRQFLVILYRWTVGRVNPDYFDLRVNQGWFVPTFSEFFDHREAVFEIEPYREETAAVSLSNRLVSFTSSGVQTNNHLFQKAVRLTERKLTYRNGQRNNYVYHLACNCNRFGIAEGDAVAWIGFGVDLGEKEVKAAVRSAYKHHFSENGKFLIR